MEKDRSLGKVLVVDDDPDTVELLRKLLEGEGYNVIVALNGEQGIKEVYDNAPEIVLMDIRLPDMDGNDALRIIKEADSDRIVIMITAYADLDNAINALKSGADDYIKKPFDNRYLIHTVNRAYERHILKRERRVLKRRVDRILKKGARLTKKDKLVLYGLTMYPDLSDINLSNKLEIPRTTVTGIKNKLWRKKFYNRERIPNFPALGCELIGFSHIKFNPSGTFDERCDKGAIDKISRNPEFVFVNSLDTEEFVIHISRNYTDFTDSADSVWDIYKENDFINEISVYHFPFKNSVMPRFMDFSSLLHSIFGLRTKHVPREKFFTSSDPDLSNTEKIVLYAMARFPNASDTEIAKNVSLSRARISQIKAKLNNSGLIKSAIIPDLGKVGCDILWVEYMEIKPCKESTIGKDIINLEKMDPRIILSILRDTDYMSISAVEDYTEYKMLRERELKFQKDKNSGILNSKSVVIPVGNITYNKLEFAPLVKKIFSLDIDF